jgi:hypothetical protein
MITRSPVPAPREEAAVTTHAETSMLALHLLQSSLVHVNTLLLQQVLAEPAWAKKRTDEDRRGLTACSGRTSTRTEPSG